MNSLTGVVRVLIVALLLLSDYLLQHHILGISIPQFPECCVCWAFVTPMNHALHFMYIAHTQYYHAFVCYMKRWEVFFCFIFVFMFLFFFCFRLFIFVFVEISFMFLDALATAKSIGNYFVFWWAVQTHTE